MLEKDWSFSADTYLCDIRTVGVLIKNRKLLVQRDRDGNEYALPGGHIKIGETLEAALVREYKEETGIDIQVKHMLWSEECFWEWKGKQVHTLSFYYLIEESDGFEIPDNGEFLSHKDNCHVLIGWMELDKLREVTVYPEFLKDEIHNLDGQIKHFVSKE